MDAMPIDFAEELYAWSSQLKSSKKMLITLEKKLLELPQGGPLLEVELMRLNSFQDILLKK